MLDVGVYFRDMAMCSLILAMAKNEDISVSEESTLESVARRVLEEVGRREFNEFLTSNGFTWADIQRYGKIVERRWPATT